MTAVKDRHREWVQSNPLRRFRQDNKLSINDAASMLDVGISTIQAWEGGVYTPNEQHMRSLAELVDDPSLPRRWADWNATKPTIGAN